jgi:WD40 repeat protein
MISVLALSRDGRILVAGGYNQFSATNPVKVMVWDVVSGKVLKSFDAPQSVISAVVSPDGSSIAAATIGKSVQVWQITPPL